MLPQLPIKGSYILPIHIIPTLTLLEEVLGRSCLITSSCGGEAERGGRHGNVRGQLRRERDVPFQEPLQMADHSSSENGVNWAEGYIEYKEFHTVITEAVAGFAHLYAYGVSKCISSQD